MKTLHLFLSVFIFAVLFSSCSDDEQKCGNEDFERYVAFPIMTPAVFKQFMTTVESGNTKYTTIYTSTSGTAKFGFQIFAKHVCPYEDILVSPTMELKFPDNNLKDSLYIQEGNHSDPDVREGILSPDGVVYLADELFTFSTINSETEFDILNVISFPAQGSWSADSIYFFGNLHSYTFSTKYKTTE